jgi:putative ABC transport system permease protein
MFVADALRDVGIVATAGSRGFAARRTGFSRPLLLSLRNTFRQRQRTVFTLIALATGGAVYIGALNLRAAIIDSVDLLFAAQRYDLVVRVTRPASAASIEGAIRTVAGVTAVEAWAGARASLRHEDGTLGDAFVITAPPAGSSLLVPDVRSGRWLAAGDQRALVVNRSLLDDEPTLHLGAVVPLLVAGSISQWTVVGVAEGGLVPQAYAEREPVAGLVHGGLVDLAVVRVSGAGARVPLAYVSQFRSELASRGFEVRGTQLTSENRRAVEDHMLMVAGFLGVMAQLMIVMGGLGLAASMSLAVLERTREIGVLKAIGARHRDIMLMVQTEGAALATLSWLAAIPLSVPMSVFIGQAFGRIMIPVPLRYVPQGAPVFQWLGVVLGVSLVACAWPAIRATRISTRAALSYE